VWCFTINGVSFLAVIAALAAMKLKPFQPPARRASAIEDLKEGLRFTTRHEIIRTLIILVGVTALFATGYGNLFPAWAVEILHGNSATNGYLQSARGIGALLGALTIASLGRFHWKGKLLTIGTFLFPVFVIVYSLMRWLPASLLLLVGVGWASMMIFNLGNALVQGLAPDELRGRVMGVYTLIFFGMFPIGSLLAGSLAEWTSLTAAVLITASISLVTAVLLYIIAPKIRKLE
jgi:predicted MFS family arabinose efflux permease